MRAVDTTFLIDLQRRAGHGKRQAAVAWLDQHGDEELVIPAIVLGEFSEGFQNAGHPVLAHFQSSYRIIAVDTNVALAYGRIARHLRKQGKPIGANDTWIAAITLTLSCPLLTRNRQHFEPVPELEIETY